MATLHNAEDVARKDVRDGDTVVIEKGGDEQLVEELAAYNPMIPQGSELTATMLLEIEDGDKRARVLATLGRIEDHVAIRIGDDRIMGVPDEEDERTNAAGKTEFQVDLKDNVLSGLTIKVSSSGGKIKAVFSGKDPKVLKLVGEQAEQLKKALAGRDYIMGDFSVADAYLFTVLNWTKLHKIDLSAFPNITAYMTRMAARPAVQEAMKAEGLLKAA